MAHNVLKAYTHSFGSVLKSVLRHNGQNSCVLVTRLVPKQSTAQSVQTVQQGSLDRLTPSQQRNAVDTRPGLTCCSSDGTALSWSTGALTASGSAVTLMALQETAAGLVVVRASWQQSRATVCRWRLQQQRLEGWHAACQQGKWAAGIEANGHWPNNIGSLVDREELPW